MKLKIPNILTIGRIILVPIFILTFYLPGALGRLDTIFYICISKLYRFFGWLIS